VIYEQFDVVRVPFPFTDKATTKRRPALVVSAAGVLSAVNETVLAMITTALHSAWPLDHPIQDINLAGLRHPSIVRFKIFTLDDRLILNKIGHLDGGDRAAVSASLVRLFGAAT
jgi:mRNA interferase MazF